VINPVVLIILDGWGIAPDGPGNAVTKADTPNFNRFWSVYPRTQLIASGESVGLPRGEDGNSETGHLNLGAGRIVFQELPRINMSIADESFFEVPAFKSVAVHVKKNSSKLHLMGLIGAGGVHSSMEHLIALINFCRREKVNKVFLHLFLDGRDSPPTSALTYIENVEREIKRNKIGEIATMMGRYYAMDRDHRWERTKIAYNALVLGKGVHAETPQEGIQKAYKSGKTDEFIEPIIIKNGGLISDHDGVIFFNFRIDRPRQLTKAFILPDFETLKIKKAAFDPYAERYGIHQYQVPGKTTTFKREKVIKNLFFVAMTEYEKGLPMHVAYIPEVVDFPLSRLIAEKNLQQFHTAETEKERHVTYYFNGRREGPFPGEEWLKISSPHVDSYDLKPAMSAPEVNKKLIEKIKMRIHSFYLVNFANPDMVGHTGVIEAGVKACEAVDTCLGKLVKSILAIGGTAIVTADHGNVEEMIDPKTGGIDTKHSTNPVPFIAISKHLNVSQQNLEQGILADVAPTILDLMGLEKPQAMTGRSLIK
jgi:2,3-bisphosphoglycerate-independent phosphoglycerate mutase